MIKFVKAYEFNGKTYATMEEAQQAELMELFSGIDVVAVNGISLNAVTTTIVENREKVIDILTTTDRSRPTARKINGATKTRKAKAAPVAPTPPTP